MILPVVLQPCLASATPSYRLFIGARIHNLRLIPAAANLIVDAGNALQRHLQQFLQGEHGGADHWSAKNGAGQGEAAADLGDNGDVEVIITCSEADAADDVDDGGRGPGRQVVGQGIAADDVEAAADLVEFQ